MRELERIMRNTGGLFRNVSQIFSPSSPVVRGGFICAWMNGKLQGELREMSLINEEKPAIGDCVVWLMFIH